jgi:hypothetical protein
MEEVIIKISPDGTQVEIDADGFVGDACKQFAGGIQSALGDTLDEKTKPEFHQHAPSGLTTKV